MATLDSGLFKLQWKDALKATHCYDNGKHFR